MKLSFHGGAGSVTGANYLLESGGTRVLIDCGLEQGNRFAEKNNYEEFAYDPKTIDAVLVTHAHIDHVGRIPRLIREGFRGPIYSTLPTKEFAELLLQDAEHLLRSEAQKNAEPPLYDLLDVEGAIKFWRHHEYHKPFQVGNFVVTFFNAGHVLGSSMIRLEAEGKKILFSGDLGNAPTPIIEESEDLPEVDYCVLESTYGDRVHKNLGNRVEDLKHAIQRIHETKGTLIIPAFAMERTQDLLYYLNSLVEQKEIPEIPIYLDSPLAIKITEVYKRHRRYYDAEAREHLKEGDQIFEFRGLHFSVTPQDSKAINSVPGPKVVIAGSGMSQGGRILYHEERYLQDPHSMILFIGYQAKDSLGRRILEGAPSVRIFGNEVPIRAERRVISGFSAHADQPRLLSVLKPIRHKLQHVYVVQGEDESSMALSAKIRNDLGIPSSVPTPHQSVEL